MAHIERRTIKRFERGFGGFFCFPACAVICALLLASCDSNDGAASVNGGDSIANGPLTAYQCLMAESCAEPVVAAHRGCHRLAPENSLAAVREAADAGVEFVEVDVRTTADGFAVLMHNSTVDSTTDGTGAVNELTLAEIRTLSLNGGNPADPESGKVPLFSDVLGLAADLGIMIYADVKADDIGPVVQCVRAGAYYDVVVMRDDLEAVKTMLTLAPDLIVMPPLEDVAGFEAALAAIPDLKIVEVSSLVPEPALCAQIMAAGVKVQQDVMVYGDILGVLGDFTGWKEFVEAGVWLLQTDVPYAIMPAITKYRETGVFPESRDDL